MEKLYTHDDRAEIAELKDEERQPCEVWTRVMGYFRPLNFNVGKNQEFADRKYFSEKTSMEHCLNTNEKLAS